jgi:phosphatidylserine decarboxylase
MSIGHSPDIPQFEPDVRQKEHEISQEEKEEAHRRIVG